MWNVPCWNIHKKENGSQVVEAQRGTKFIDFCQKIEYIETLER
jgi:hypothetical protein